MSTRRTPTKVVPSRMYLGRATALLPFTTAQPGPVEAGEAMIANDTTTETTTTDTELVWRPGFGWVERPVSA